jgi:hypothetical protein
MEKLSLCFTHIVDFESKIGIFLDVNIMLELAGSVA